MFCELDVLRAGHQVLETYAFVTRNGSTLISTYSKARIESADATDARMRLFEDTLKTLRKSGVIIVSDNTTGEIVYTTYWTPRRENGYLMYHRCEGGHAGAWREGITVSAVELEIVKLQDAVKGAARLRRVLAEKGA